jgi:hypothetical protein
MKLKEGQHVRCCFADVAGNMYRYSNISHARIAALQENDKRGNEEDKSLLKKARCHKQA